jgi:hypothetical protein
MFTHQEEKAGKLFARVPFPGPDLVLYNPTDVGLGVLAETESHF